MIKLLICLLSVVALSTAVVQLRQQRWELQYQCNQLHNQVERQQAKLWSQQLQIAVYTAPNAIMHTVSSHDLKLVPSKPLPGGVSNWMNADGDDEAAAE